VAYLPYCGIGLLRANHPGPYISMLMSVLLISNFSFVHPSQTYGQSDPFTPLTCVGLPIAGIAASGDDVVNVASRAVDNNIDTRWSSLGLGSWIQADLGQIKTICSVGINWHRGNERVNSFVISVSTDGKAFTNVFSGKSDGASLTEQSYNFQSATGRFVRFTVMENTQSNWVSIAELKIYGHKPLESNTCANSPILKVTGPSIQSYPPSNVIDNNLGTVWSNYGVGSSIVLDLGASKSTCSVEIAWYKGNERQSNFAISTSLDGTSYNTVLTATSSGKTASFENYVFADKLARYIKITVNGNTQNNYATIAEVQIQISSVQADNHCVDQTVEDVKTSGSQTSFPGSNVLDKDLNSRWSNYGIGSWIQLDLGTVNNICSVDIAWYKGNERQNNFVISASNDSAKFSHILDTTSSGSTLEKEKYSIDGSVHLSARYIRITVNGNTQNAYASITEISIDKVPLIPVLDTSKTLRIAVVGDVDNNNGLVTELNLMKKYAVQQFVLPGDYAYSNGPAVLDKAKTAGFDNSNTIIAVGNHDSCSSVKSYLGNSLCYYQKTLGNLDFFVLDANSGFDCTGTQFQTITSKIQSSVATHKVVVIHQPFVTVKSTQGPNGKFSCFDAKFQSSGVDVVAQAHNHNYQLGKIGNIFYGVFGMGTHDTGSSMYGCGSNSFNDHPIKCITGTNGIEIIDFSLSSNKIKGYFISNEEILVHSWSN